MKHLVVNSNYFCCRKYTLILNNIVIFLGVGLESLAIHPTMLIVGRFIVGVGAGKRERERTDGGREEVLNFIVIVVM